MHLYLKEGCKPSHAERLACEGRYVRQQMSQHGCAPCIASSSPQVPQELQILAAHPVGRRREKQAPEEEKKTDTDKDKEDEKNRNIRPPSIELKYESPPPPPSFH